MKKITKISLLSLSVFLLVIFVIITVFAYTNNITTLAEAKAFADNIFNAEKMKF